MASRIGALFARTVRRVFRVPAALLRGLGSPVNEAAEPDASATDPWVSRARPTFLYVMYAMILWALPMGFVAAISPATSNAMSEGMGAYLSALPEPLYVLFGTGYLGYATLRQFGKGQNTRS